VFQRSKETSVNGTRKIVILGTGGSSVDILDTINDINRASNTNLFECIGFLDDRDSLWGKAINGVKVLGSLSSAGAFDDCHFINGVGSSSNFWKKREIILRTAVDLERFPTIVHPSASVSRTAQLGFGTVVFQHVTITSNVTVGNHVIILPNSVVSHDNLIGDYTCLATGVCVSGGVKVGESCYLGANATIIENVEIGDYCLIGMGTVVLKDVPANSVVVGNPAKLVRFTRDG
jgi:sugar O-acyltransferase (sialic acid O-acetyltransferase NeuD family)